MAMFEFYPYIPSEDHIHLRGVFLMCKKIYCNCMSSCFQFEKKSDVKQEFRASIHNTRTQDL